MQDTSDKPAVTALAPKARDTELAATNYEAIKLEFFRGNLKLSEFCSMYPQVPGLYQRAVNLGWIAERKEFRASISTEAGRRLANRGADYEMKLDGMTHRAAKKLTRLIGDILTSTVEMADRAKNQEGDGARLTLDDLPKLRSGIEALAQAHKLARITAHLTPEPVPTGGELDLQKLDHPERQQLASLLQKAKRGPSH